MKKLLILILLFLPIVVSAQIGRYPFYTSRVLVEVAPADSFLFSSVQTASIDQVTISYRVHANHSVFMNWGNGTIVPLIADATQRTVTSNYSTANTTYYPRITGDIDAVYDLYIYYESTVVLDYDEFATLPSLLYLLTTGVSANSFGTVDSLPEGLQICILGNNTTGNVTGTVDDFPKSITRLEMSQSPGITGSLADLPDNIEYLLFFGMNGLGTQSLDGLSTKDNFKYIRIYIPTLTGSIDSYPKGLRYINVSADTETAVTGSIDNLPKSLEYLKLDSPNITGDIRNLSGSLLTILLQGNITATEGIYPRWSNTVMTLSCGWTTTEVDIFLNGWAGTCGLGTAARTINLAGTNQARSSASDAAFTDMDINKNKTFIMTP